MMAKLSGLICTILGQLSRPIGGRLCRKFSCTASCIGLSRRWQVRWVRDYGSADRESGPESGKSNYGIGRTIRVFLDLIMVKFLLDYSTRPLQFFGLLGLAGSGSRILPGVAAGVR